MTGYERFGQAMSLIKLLIIENSYNDITVVAPGNNWKDFAESLNPKRIIDRDMFLNYENKDVIFDDVTIEENQADDEINDQDSLVSTLHRIDSQLDQLSHYLNNDSNNIDDT